MSATGSGSVSGSKGRNDNSRVARSLTDRSVWNPTSRYPAGTRQSSSGRTPAACRASTGTVRRRTAGPVSGGAMSCGSS